MHAAKEAWRPEVAREQGVEETWFSCFRNEADRVLGPPEQGAGAFREDLGVAAVRDARAIGALQLQAGANIETVARMSSPHDQMLAVLQRRARLAGHVRALWGSGRLESLGAELRPPEDHAALCDFFRVLMRRRLFAFMDLAACVALLPALRNLAASPREVFAATAFHSVELLLRHFGDGLADAGDRRPFTELAEIHRLVLQSSVLGRFGGFRVSLETFLQRCGP